ncbi:MAG TPA: DNA/RNA non-specific endonuclease [Flavobacterium sp.]|nr:DNA/RNA non-specific endonuclease [Flavobacterium sp.]
MSKKTFKFSAAVFLGIAVFLASESGFFKNHNAADGKAIESTQGNYQGDAEKMLPASTTGQVVRHTNYILSYNEKYEQAEWVFYYLDGSKSSKTNFKRPYFMLDPKVETKSADYKNYKNSGYDKGHLCPAADRKFSKEAFEETFFTSNVSPQKHEFNAGIWNRLENKTRYWAKKSGGLYVVAGGVLKDGLKTIGREKVAVPGYFYKILLQENGGDYKMIAFLMPAEMSDRPLYEYAVAVDEVETITGIDFFPALPDAVENELEKSSNYKSWSFGKSVQK